MKRYKPPPKKSRQPNKPTPKPHEKILRAWTRYIYIKND